MTKQLKYRQGDVLFTRVGEVPNLPRSTKARANGIIAYGEVTGHAHRVAVLDAAEVLEIGESLYVRVTAAGGVSIVHEEHGPIVLPQGDYCATIQQEYTPEEIRSVRD